MSDSDGSPQQDDRHRRRFRSRFPVFPRYAGETLAEREERQLAEAAVPVKAPAELPAQETVAAGGAAPAAQAGAPATPPPEEAPGAQCAGTAAPASRVTAPAGHTVAPSPLPAHRTGPARASSVSPGAAAAAAEGREGTSTAPTQGPSHPQTSPPKPYPAKAAFPKGRPRAIRHPAPPGMSPGITLPQLQQQRERPALDPGGGGRRTGGAGYQPRERQTRGGRRQGERPGTDTGDRPGRTR